MGRSLAMWLGSYLIVSVMLFLWYKIPLGPLVLAGGLTLAITVIRSFRAQRRSRS